MQETTSIEPTPTTTASSRKRRADGDAIDDLLKIAKHKLAEEEKLTADDHLFKYFCSIFASLSSVDKAQCASELHALFAKFPK